MPLRQLSVGWSWRIMFTLEEENRPKFPLLVGFASAKSCVSTVTVLFRLAVNTFFGNSLWDVVTLHLLSAGKMRFSYIAFNLWSIPDCTYMLALAYEKTYIRKNWNCWYQWRESPPVTTHQSLFILIDLRSNLDA